MLLWAFATVKSAHEHSFNNGDSSHAAPSSHASPPLLPQTPAAYPSIPPHLLGALVPRIHASLGEDRGGTGSRHACGLSGQELSNVLWSLAVLPNASLYDTYDLFDHAARMLMAKRRPKQPRPTSSALYTQLKEEGLPGPAVVAPSSTASALGASEGGLRALKRQMQYARRKQVGLNNSLAERQGYSSCLLDDLKPLEIGKVAWAYAKVRQLAVCPGSH